MSVEFKKQRLNSEFFKQMDPYFDKQGKTLPGVSPTHSTLYGLGDRWNKNRRPFFNVWPNVEKCLANTDLRVASSTIPRSVIHDLKVIEVRTAVGSKIRPFFLGVYEESDDVVTIHYPTVVVCLMEDWDGKGAIPGIAGQQHPMNTSFWEFEDDKSRNTGTVSNLDWEPYWRIAYGCLLLACDERFIEPVLLSRDRLLKPTGTAKAEAIERTKKSYNFGFDIGKELEMSPHFRRPHFGLRWTGEGRTIPKLVPVKGCIVNRVNVAEIPTGYDGEMD